MTAPTVTQRDREAAAYQFVYSPEQTFRILHGQEDKTQVVQAFARHREQTVAEMVAVVDKAIREHADKHGPSGGAWNISSVLDCVIGAIKNSEWSAS